MDDLFDAMAYALNAKYKAQQKQVAELKAKLAEIEKHRKATKRIFVKERVRKGLDLAHRMIVFKLLYNLEYTQDVRYY